MCLCIIVYLCICLCVHVCVGLPVYLLMHVSVFPCLHLCVLCVCPGLCVSKEKAKRAAHGVMAEL